MAAEGTRPHVRETVEGTALFGGLGPDALESVLAELDPRSLRGGEVLFQQGESGDALYVVVSGRLRVERSHEGRIAVLREVGRGESVGELSLLTGAPRSASVRAVRDTELVRLTRERFDVLMEAHPRIAIALTRMLAGWLAAPPRRTAAAVSAVALVPAGADAPVAPVARALAAALAGWGPTAHLNAAALDQRLWMGAGDAEQGDGRHAVLTRWLDDQERHHTFVVYEGDARGTEWTRRTLRHADVVLEVARADQAPPAAEVGSGVAHAWASRELVLVQDAGTKMPSGTAAWLAARGAGRHHHVRLGRIEDVSRLARRLTGRAVGVALSGGGARGFAHIGALRAIEEAGIPVDEIGGTSMGAILAAQYAAGHSVDEMLAMNRELWHRYRPHKAYTLPYSSIVTERAAQRMLERMFGEACLEDFWIECFCCSTNITRAELSVHRSGPVVHALLASMAIPGVAPPIVGTQGELLVDGGVLDNVPAAHLHRGAEGAVIACDASPDEDIRADPSYVTNPSQWRVVANKLNPLARTRYFPSIFEVLTRSAVVASTRETRRVRESADLYLRPSVAGYGIFEFERIDELVEAGYAHAAAPARAWWQGRARSSGERRTTGVMI